MGKRSAVEPNGRRLCSERDEETTPSRLLLATSLLRAHNSRKPRAMETQQQVERANALEQEAGSSHRWKVGDQYYFVVRISKDRRNKRVVPA